MPKHNYTPEQFARLRIKRLRAKHEQLTANINRLALPPVGQQASLQIDQLMRARRSTITALKRWERQLVDAGLMRYDECIHYKPKSRKAPSDGPC